MWKQLKILSDYVVVEITKGCPERFINLCRFNGISMWDIYGEKGKIEAKISKKDFLKIRQHVKKSKVHVKIKKKTGAGFFIFRYRKHYSFAVGIFLSFFLINVLSLYVWNISFVGNTEYTDEFLSKYMQNHSYHVGMKISDIDCDEIESGLRNHFDNITWVSAQISGTRLIVHIKENDGAVLTAKNENKGFNDIYADCNGVIVSIVTRNGTPLVKEGDSVNTGDELVRGSIDIISDDQTLVTQEKVNADADIVIMTELKYSDCVNRKQNKKIYTGRKKTNRICGISDKNVELGIGWNPFLQYDMVTEVKNLSLVNDFYLPVRYGTCTYYEYENKIVELSDYELEKQLKENLNVYLEKLQENKVQICDNRVNITLNSNSGIMEGIIEAKITEGSGKKQ